MDSASSRSAPSSKSRRGWKRLASSWCTGSVRTSLVGGLMSESRPRPRARRLVVIAPFPPRSPPGGGAGLVKEDAASRRLTQHLAGEVEVGLGAAALDVVAEHGHA